MRSESGAGLSPELKSNVFSYFTWQWMQPFITLGNKKILQAEDLYNLNPRETTEYCERKWYDYSEKRKRKTGKSPPVFVLRFVVQLAEERDNIRWWRCAALVLGMLLSTIVQSIAQHYLLTRGRKCGMRIRSGVSMAVFNKVMQMRTVALAGTSSGQILNLVTNDTQKFLDAATYLSYTTFAVVDSAVVGAIAVGEVGLSALSGVVIILLAQVVQMCIAQGVGAIRRRSVQFTDARVRTIQEILSGVRVVKYNGWTNAFLARIEAIRKSEMNWIRKGVFLRSSSSCLREGVAPLAALATFGTYVGVHKGNLSASKAFTILGLYSILVRVYSICPIGALAAWESRIGIQRLQKLLDLPNGKCNGSQEEVEQIRKCYPEAAVAISEGTFSWKLTDYRNDRSSVSHSGHHPDAAGREQRAYNDRRKNSSQELQGVQDLSLNLEQQISETHPATGNLKGINVAAWNGQLVAIIGAVGSGKSSLLYAFLGEMECVQGAVLLDAPVSYAPQQPWIFNETIKNNILFGSEYDEARYRRTISACALDLDIQSMPGGDDTEIGERGLNLSGGQKARVSLARACYSSSRVAVLDDPLAAVDVPTARHLILHVLGGILKGRTVILVTHNKSSLELCDRVYKMQDGELQEVEPQEELIQSILSDEEQEEAYDAVHIKQTNFTLSGRSIDDSSPKVGKLSGIVEIYSGTSKPEGLKNQQTSNGKNAAPEGNVTAGTQASAALTVKEDRATGEVTRKTYIAYAKGSGLWLWALVLFLLCFVQAVRVMVDYWVSIWVSFKYNLSTNLYLGIYAVWIAGLLVFTAVRSLAYSDAAIRAATTMHRVMANAVLRSPQLFFDQNPVGRIMNRFGKDQALVDDDLPFTAQEMLEQLVSVLGAMVFLAVIMPWILLTFPPFLFIFWYCQRRYVSVSRELKRLDGLSRSPIYAHLSQTLQGVTTVRAYRREKAMHDHLQDCIDANHRAYILFVHASRWLGVRLDFAAAICATATVLLAILLRHSLSPGVIGVALVQSFQLTDFFQYGVRMIAETENIFTSVERNQAYANLPSEANPHSPPGLISDEWPEKGKVEFINYSMAYRPDLPLVLNNLTFTVHAQEKVGILGRTGAGKSSLVAAIFRMVENSTCSGSILIDAVDVKLVGLDDLRLRLSIIPQDPVLFRGTVRLNLDPFEQHDDLTIFEALAKVQLSAKIRTLEAGLDSVVTENGDNFSVGQRQLLCLARSLLRRSKIIVMDEATAAVDGDTDQLIQNTIRSVFQGCTVLTIAHRIDTVIDSDRVLVLAEGGSLSEFDSPVNLLRHADKAVFSDLTHAGRTEHIFASMVSQAGPAAAEQLRDAAEAAERKRL